MQTSYDILFITTMPAFYKVNLFNAVAQNKKILVVYTGSSTGIRSKDFIKNNACYDQITLKSSAYSAIGQFIKLIHKTTFDKVVISGWDNVISFLAAIAFPKQKLACIVESSIYESTTKGLRASPKRFLLRRVALVYASGKSQTDLVRALGYKGSVIEFGGCGILNYQPQPAFEKRVKVKQFLYVGQLVEKKNINLLIEYFNEHPELNLTVIGDGVLKEQLKASANNNIVFLGAIDNDKLPQYYQEADVFILPSKIEPWGLVVEEALNNGTPVIVSSRVGCAQSLVIPHGAGLVFESENKKELSDCLERMLDYNYYNQLRKNVSLLDFVSRAEYQIQCFCK